MTGVFVARATARDAEELARLQAACHAHPWTPAQIAAEAAAPPPAGVIVARTRGGRACAACTYHVAADEMEILDVCVEPGSRRRGLARLLLGLALARGARAGARRAYLEVRASNAPALSLYAALGFRPRGVRRGYYRSPEEDAVLLERPIADC